MSAAVDEGGIADLTSLGFALLIVSRYSMATGEGSITDRAMQTFVAMLRCAAHHFKPSASTNQQNTPVRFDADYVEEKCNATVKRRIATVIKYATDIIEHRLNGRPGLPLPIR